MYAHEGRPVERRPLDRAVDASGRGVAVTWLSISEYVAAFGSLVSGLAGDVAPAAAGDATASAHETRAAAEDVGATEGRALGDAVGAGVVAAARSRRPALGTGVGVEGRTPATSSAATSASQAPRIGARGCESWRWIVPWPSGRAPSGTVGSPVEMCVS